MRHEQDISPALTDRFGRSADYLRLSVTDRCDLRCVYYTAEQMTFLPRKEILTFDELHDVHLENVDMMGNAVEQSTGRHLPGTGEPPIGAPRRKSGGRV